MKRRENRRKTVLRVCQNTPTEHFDRDVPANTMDLQPAAAHALFFEEKQFARLQADMYFSTRTCRAEKWIESYFVLADETLRGVFLTS